MRVVLARACLRIIASSCAFCQGTLFAFKERTQKARCSVGRRLTSRKVTQGWVTVCLNTPRVTLAASQKDVGGWPNRIAVEFHERGTLVEFPARGTLAQWQTTPISSRILKDCVLKPAILQDASFQEHAIVGGGVQTGGIWKAIFLLWKPPHSLPWERRKSSPRSLPNKLDASAAGRPGDSDRRMADGGSLVGWALVKPFVQDAFGRKYHKAFPHEPGLRPHSCAGKLREWAVVISLCVPCRGLRVDWQLFSFDVKARVGPSVLPLQASSAYCYGGYRAFHSETHAFDCSFSRSKCCFHGRWGRASAIWAEGRLVEVRQSKAV